MICLYIYINPYLNNTNIYTHTYICTLSIYNTTKHVPREKAAKQVKEEEKKRLEEEEKRRKAEIMRANRERFGQDSEEDAETDDETKAKREVKRKEEDVHEALFALSITPGAKACGDVWGRDAVSDVVRMLESQDKRYKKIEAEFNLRSAGLALLADAGGGGGGGGGERWGGRS